MKKQTLTKQNVLITVAVVGLFIALPAIVYYNAQQKNLNTNAAGAAAIEAESGTAAGNVSTISDSNASGGQYLRFGSVGSPIIVGYQTPTGGFDSGNNSILSATQITIGSNAGTLQSMSIYLGTITAAPNNHMQVALYSDNGSNAPGTLLASGTSTVITTGWNMFALPTNVTTTANTKYWLAFNMDGSTTQFGWGNGTGISKYKFTTPYGSMPNTFGTPSLTDNRPYAIYLTYLSQQALTPTPTSPPVPTLAPGAGAPFAANSFWNTQIPTNATLDPNSSAFVANIAAQIQTYYGHGDINIYDYTPPVYRITASTPTTPATFKFNDCQGKGYTPTDLMSQFVNVPMPANAQPAGGTDQEMVIWDQTNNTMWEMWQSEKRADGWYTCWGGKMTNISTSDGIYPFNFGTTATGLPFMGGIMTIQELQQGQINHAIGLALVDIRSGTQSWPANRNDGYVSGANVPAEGQRFRLDPTLNVDALNLHPMAKMIAKAAQKYGFVIWDKSGVVGVRAENPQPITAAGGTDPYIQLMNGTPGYQLMDNFPWNKLQAMPWDYGKP